jgi:uncharacterized protein (TIGR02996 family)
MTDEPAILAAIAAHPDEDTPRLAYADWLDENGQPIRAEFIRVQCAIKQIETLPSADVQRYADLYRRQDAILTDHRRDLLGPLADDLTPFDAVFDRGFVAELTLRADVFLRNADAVASLTPLPRVAVTDGATHVWSLALSGHAGVIAELVMQSPHRPDPERLTFGQVQQALCQFATWDRLTKLDLAGCRVSAPDDNDALPLIADSRTFPALTDLDLSGNDVTDDGVGYLVASPLWPRLRRLVLGGNPITDVGAEHLAAAAPTGRLEYLNLRFTPIGPDAHPRLLRTYGGRVDLF